MKLVTSSLDIGGSSVAVCKESNLDVLNTVASQQPSVISIYVLLLLRNENG